MTRTRNKIVAIVLMIALSLSLVVTIAHFAPFAHFKESSEEKILFEYSDGFGIVVTDSIDNVPTDAYSQDSGLAMQIMFNYDHYSDAIYDDQSSEGESFVEHS